MLYLRPVPFGSFLLAKCWENLPLIVFLSSYEARSPIKPSSLRGRSNLYFQLWWQLSWSTVIDEGSLNPKRLVVVAYGLYRFRF